LCPDVGLMFLLSYLMFCPDLWFGYDIALSRYWVGLFPSLYWLFYHYIMCHISCVNI